MSDTNDRIEQFRKMAEADPNNELGHFSLGRALLDAGMTDQAVGSFNRVIELNPNIGKVYQLLATALLKLGQRDDAIHRLTEGVKIAQSRGDLMPRNEMVKMLKELGSPVPAEVEAAAAAGPAAAGAGEVFCKRCGKVSRKLPSPPFKNAFGQLIFENTCADCWREAIGMGTKVINELRLPMSDPQASKIWDQHIREFLNL
jgi:Fe-S cluster biosynthesis and repair protein YggX